MKLYITTIAILSLFKECSVFAQQTYNALRHRKLRRMALPCLLIQKHVRFDGAQTGISSWDCEMQGEDSVTAGGSFGSPMILDIDGLDDETVKNNNVISGVTTINVPGAEIDNGRLRIPAGVSMEFGMMPDRREQNMNNKNGQRTLADTTDVTRNVLVARVTATDTSPTSSLERLSDKVFGTDGDVVNLKTQYEACSYGSLQIEPATGNNIQNGVVEISVNLAATGTANKDLRLAALDVLKTTYGDIASQFDHIMLCLPPGTSGTWAAYGYNNHFLTVYNNEKCTYPSLQVHEVGHNLNLNHSGENGNAYADETGMMGYSVSMDEGPKMCFNPGKSWNLAWYADRHATATPLSATWSGKLVGVADYDLTTEEHTIVIRLENGEKDLFIGFNRKAGINSGTCEAGDLVTVVEQNGFGPSMLVAKLGQGENGTIPNYLGGTEEITIMVNSIDTSSSPAYAEVSVCVTGACPTPTPPPTTPPPTTPPPTTPPPTTPPPTTPECTIDSDCSDNTQCTHDVCSNGTCTYTLIAVGSCGDGICQENETCENCPEDCSSRLKSTRNIAAYCCYGGSSAPTFENANKYAGIAVDCSDTRCGGPDHCIMETCHGGGGGGGGGGGDDSTCNVPLGGNCKAKGSICCEGTCTKQANMHRCL